MNHVQLCLSARKSRESSFYHCGRHVMLLQACLNAGMVLKSCLIRRADAMKHVQAFLRAMRDGESSFHHHGCMVKHVYMRQRPHKAIFTAEEVL